MSALASDSTTSPDSDLGADLRVALEAGELAMHFQPIIHLDTGRVRGVEALLRWDHQTRGPVSPLMFVPVAAESDLIFQLGMFALRESCSVVATWVRDGDVAAGFGLSVNLSAREIADLGVADRVRDVVEETGLTPETLCLEMTEAALMVGAESANANLQRLATLGVKLAVDNFGTGYSSLLILKQMPMTQLNIDRRFVAGLGVDQDDSAIVASVVGLADAMGMTSIAEGVETHGQAAALQRMGCRLAQGFFFSRPVPGWQLPSVVRQIEARGVDTRNAPSDMT